MDILEFIRENLTIILLIWFALGIHSAIFLVKRFTYHYDFRISESWMLLVCVILPIVTHLMTMVVFPKPDKDGNEKVLFKHRKY